MVSSKVGLALTAILFPLSSTNGFSSTIRTPRGRAQVTVTTPPSTSASNSRLFISSSPSSTSSSSDNDTNEQLASSSNNDVKTDSVVVGAGPAGLLTAIMLAQKFPQQTIQVYDRLAQPPSPTDQDVWSDVAKFYLIGLGARGQRALDHYGVWDDVEAVCTAVVGRKDWSPESGAEDGVENIFKDRPVTTQVLPRDKLVGVMHDHVKKHYGDRIQLNYGYEIIPEDFAADSNTAVRLRASKCDNTNGRQNPTTATDKNGDEPTELCDLDKYFTVTTKLLVAADGTARTVANEMEKNDEARWNALNAIQKLSTTEKPFKINRYVDDNRRVYKTIPMKIPSDWRPDLNYSARTKDGRINYDALPADKNGNYCGVLLIKDSDEFAKADNDPVKLRELLDEALPQFSALLDDSTVADVAKKPVSFLPSFRYAGPRLNQGDRTLILGDCAHTVKPYFGLGANSALEDVRFLEEAIDQGDNIPEAVHLFSKKRAKESKSLVKLSRELDRPGKLGFLTFILPLIMDSIFHGMLPKIFERNTIAMLQKEGVTFTGVRRRKRMDRLGQVALIGMGMAALTTTAKALVGGVAKATGKTSATVYVGFSGAAILASLLSKFASLLNPNTSPADVLGKTKTKK